MSQNNENTEETLGGELIFLDEGNTTVFEYGVTKPDCDYALICRERTVDEKDETVWDILKVAIAYLDENFEGGIPPASLVSEVCIGVDEYEKAESITHNKAVSSSGVQLCE